MTDPVLEAVRGALGAGFATLRRTVEGLPAEALNRRPAGSETNSIAVLTTHAMQATRLLLAVALGLPAPPRDRPAEFAAVAAGPDSLLRLVDEVGEECRATLDSAGRVDLSAPRQRKRDSGEVVTVPAAEMLLQAVTHLRGHADEAALTRHFWSARS